MRFAWSWFPGMTLFGMPALSSTCIDVLALVHSVCVAPSVMSPRCVAKTVFNAARESRIQVVWSVNVAGYDSE